MKNPNNNIFRRDFLKGLATVPFLGYFSFAFKNNVVRELNKYDIDSYKILGVNNLEAPKDKLKPTNHDPSKRIRFGVVGNGWRGEQLLYSLGYMHPDDVKNNIKDGKYNKTLKKFLQQEDLNIEFTAVSDTFIIHAQRGVEISSNDIRPGGQQGKTKPAKIYPTYREMIESKEVDAIIIATPDHTHSDIAITAAKAGIHVYLEKPMTHSIEEAVALRNSIKSTGVKFQLGHENRQQMSFKMAREMVQKGVLGDISMVQTYTNRNGLDGAWIRKRKYDELGNINTINWKEFLGTAPWHEFDPKRYFNWQRYNDYGTGFTGNNFSHQYDCVNQILSLGIPESAVAAGGQYYYKNHGEMPDVLSGVFNYPRRGLVMTLDGTLKSGIYRENYILGSEASMYVDLGITIYKDDNSERYKNLNQDKLYTYAGESDVDAITTATSKAYMKGGYGATYIDGKVIDATYLHLKEFFDAIRDNGKTSCNIDAGFEESVTVHMVNMAFENKRMVTWDPINEKTILS
jgi:predicted dehydrogenase